VKMYILIKNDLAVGHSVLAAAHASLACYLKFQNDERMRQWVSGVFYKVVCVVSPEEFERAKEVEDNVVMTESSLGGAEVAVAFCPREEWPKMFRFLRLLK